MATINDIVLIYFEGEPLVYARIEDILPDHKPDWYHVKLLFLQVPLQVVTWILRGGYINGGEFTMNGKRMRVEKIACPQDEPEAPPADSGRKGEPSAAGKAKVISLKDLKKK